MKIDTKKLCEKILSYYKNNVELNDNITEFERGYLQCLTEINVGKYS